MLTPPTSSTPPPIPPSPSHSKEDSQLQRPLCLLLVHHSLPVVVKSDACLPLPTSVFNDKFQQGGCPHMKSLLSREKTVLTDSGTWSPVHGHFFSAKSPKIRPMLAGLNWCNWKSYALISCASSWNDAFSAHLQKALYSK